MPPIAKLPRSGLLLPGRRENELRMKACPFHISFVANEHKYLHGSAKVTAGAPHPVSPELILRRSRKTRHPATRRVTGVGGLRSDGRETRNSRE